MEFLNESCEDHTDIMQQFSGFGVHLKSAENSRLVDTVTQSCSCKRIQEQSRQ